MKARESLVRLKEFQVREKQRQLSQLQMMMAEFERMTKDLENQIVFEEKKSGISDPRILPIPLSPRLLVKEPTIFRSPFVN